MEPPHGKSFTLLHANSISPPSGSTKVEIGSKNSAYVMEICLPDVGMRDVAVAKTLVKEFTASRPVGGRGKISSLLPILWLFIQYKIMIRTTWCVGVMEWTVEWCR